MDIFSFLNEIGFFDLMDIGVMTLFIYLVLVWFKKTRAASVLIGILMVGGFYLLARQLNLFLTASVFQAFFAVILVAMVVIFQEELRHFFERVAVLGQTPFGKRKPQRLLHQEVAALVRALSDFAKERIGALIVLKGKDRIGRHLEGGEELGGLLSEALLKSLFDPHSPGHDGAVVIEGNLIAQFACHLPLSKNFKLLRDHGTRHAAGLGLSELSDALCLVASEEKGTLSYMRYGEIHKISDSEGLSAVLEKFYKEVSPPREEPKNLKDLFKKNFQEKVLALFLAGLLWFLQVYGAKVVYRTVHIPVNVAPLANGLVIKEMNPSSVDLTVAAPRRAFYFFQTRRITILIKTWVAQPGRYTLRVSASDISLPKNFVIENILPKRIEVEVN